MLLLKTTPILNLQGDFLRNYLLLVGTGGIYNIKELMN